MYAAFGKQANAKLDKRFIDIMRADPKFQEVRDHLEVQQLPAGMRGQSADVDMQSSDPAAASTHPSASADVQMKSPSTRP